MLGRLTCDGGWGITIIFWFSQTLAMKCLWRVLMDQGLWGLVMRSKYLEDCSVIEWMRKKIGQSTSNIWYGLVGAFEMASKFALGLILLLGLQLYKLYCSYKPL